MKSKLFILDYKDLFNGPLIAFLADDLWDHKDTWNRSSLWLAPLLSRLWLQALAQHLEKPMSLTIFGRQDY